MAHQVIPRSYIPNIERFGRRDNFLWAHTHTHTHTQLQLARSLESFTNAMRDQSRGFTLVKPPDQSEWSNDFSRPTVRVSFTTEAPVSVFVFSARSSSMLLASSFICPAHAAKSHQRCESVKIYRWPQVDNAGKRGVNIGKPLAGTCLIA